MVNSSVEDPDPGSGMGKKSGPGSGIIFPRAYKPCFWVKILKFFDADPGSGMEKVRIRDGKKSDPGSGKTSATLVNSLNVHCSV
jgi:hypothetical protein